VERLETWTLCKASNPEPRTREISACRRVLVMHAVVNQDSWSSISYTIRIPAIVGQECGGVPRTAAPKGAKVLPAVGGHRDPLFGSQSMRSGRNRKGKGGMATAF